MIATSTRAVLLTTLFSFAAFAPDEVWARGRGGGNSAKVAKQVMIAQATQTLAYNRQVLAEAETVINESSNTVSEAQSRLENARKSVTDAKSTAYDSAKSQRTLEAEILAAQGESSDYFKANVAFTEAQEAMNEAKEHTLSSDSYLKQKAQLMQEEGNAIKVAKLQKDVLEEDNDYQIAKDKFKAATLVYNRIKHDLFRANSDWVAASQAAREAHSEESKAGGEATRGAMKKMPAMRSLREAQGVAEEARANIAQAEMVLKNLKAPIPKPSAGDPSYTSPSAANGK